MFLKKLAYPCKYSDLFDRFGRQVPVLSMITIEVIDHIYGTHHHNITNWNDDILNPIALQTYADAISAKGTPLAICSGFVDGTVVPVSKSGECQRVMHNRHKRVHGIKFQSIALANDW